MYNFARPGKNRRWFMPLLFLNKRKGIEPSHLFPRKERGSGLSIVDRVNFFSKTRLATVKSVSMNKLILTSFLVLK
ncbi:hypothetical protein DXB27_20980 [Parabacteroides gordonii]|nr:hypothetical protein DXB27_20980 [Parabacteroides gordonii]